MKTLFAHDHRFFQQGSTMLSKNAFDAAVWDRYLEHTDELVVVARVFDLPTDADISKYGISSAPHVSFKHLPASHHWTNMLPYNQAQQKMNQEVSQVDAVIARLPSRIGTMAVKAAKKLGKPYAIEVVGDPVESYLHHGSKTLKLLAKRTGNRMKENISSCSHVLYVTQQDLQEKYPTTGMQRSASNVEIDTISEHIASAREARIHTQQNKIVKIGIIATLNTNYKGIDTAIEAMQLLQNSHPQTHLYILGPGNPDKWLQLAVNHHVAEAVRFCGILPAGEAVLNWLDTMDIYIQPSRTEGVPRALIEAMARGCAAVGSTAGGIPELLSPEYIHEIGNAHALADILSDLMQHPEKQIQQSKQNIAMAASYTKPVLQKRRAELFASFFDTVKNKERTLS
ncbi:glycosyltransferase family 4 protein [Listeria booriae]|uniref:glycosyltransferase n=1 Tax=Listeria booriae TaxID=1552123 RepID=UPI00162552A4|nr:glycosyltransferase [Listeria booriae]MBC2263811.1 glycosyltransferase family 4 protein [Listeria booriae]